MDEFVKIEGCDFVRDLQSGAVVNNNKSEYENFIAAKRKEKSNIERIENLENLVIELLKVSKANDSLINDALNKCRISATKY